jgi:hypothetical protein
VESCDPVPDPDGIAFALLSQDIDEGEAILMASAAIHPKSLLVTGDKRSLIALCRQAEEHHTLILALAGRVLCFEAILQKLIASPHVGFSYVRERVVGGLLSRQHPEHRDKALAIIFPSGLETTPEVALVALNSYVNDLRRQTGALHQP